jgi:hypothetical protein
MTAPTIAQIIEDHTLYPRLGGQMCDGDGCEWCSWDDEGLPTGETHAEHVEKLILEAVATNGHTAEKDAGFWDKAETLAERDARFHAWLAGVHPGDIVTVRLNSTDTLTGKVYEAPDARGTSLCVNTVVLRHGNGYPGGSYELPGPDTSDIPPGGRA